MFFLQLILPPFQIWKLRLDNVLCYEIDIMFGEISLKLCQTKRIVARNNVNVVADELANKLDNNLYLFNNWYLDSTVSMHINAIICVVVPSAQIGGFPMKLAPNVFDFTVDTPSSPESAY